MRGKWTVLVAAIALQASTAALAATLRIDNVFVVDPAIGDVSPLRSVLIENGRVVETLTDAEVRSIDAKGAFLLPGLTEMHAHLPPMAESQRLQDVLQLFLAHGVTTVRGMLGEPGHLALRKALDSGTQLGPRLITSGPSINGRSAPTPDAAEAMVKEQSAAGYDFLKLHPGLSAETYAVIVRTARELDMAFAGHVSEAVGLDRTLAAGQATIDHLDGYAQKLVRDGATLPEDIGLFGVNLPALFEPSKIEPLALRTREAGVWNVPTQTLLENLAAGDLETLQHRPAMRYVTNTTRARWALNVAQMQAAHSPQELALYIAVRRALILALHDAGAGLLLGSDAPQIMNVPGDSLHHELELLVAAGLSPAAALATGTTRVAEFLKEPTHGCLQPGCIADGVLLGGNPLEDISTVRDVRAVMRDGQWLDRAALNAILEGIAARSRS